MRTILLDTNVLLAHPGALFEYPGAEIILPETVLVELDKLKTSRADADLRFRGREVSRTLFELSEGGSLTLGVDLPGDSRLRVVALENETDLPEGLSARNADDRILAVALQECGSGRCEDLVVVTNDLNMLLKAQTLGLRVERHREGADHSFGRRFIIRPFQRYRVPLTILAIALAVFVGIVAVAVWGIRTQPGSTAVLPPEFRENLSTEQVRLYDLITRLERHPDDSDARLELANLYFDLRDRTGSLDLAFKALKHYDRYLEQEPEDVNARADYAAVLFYSGQTDQAIQQVSRVLESEPDHIRANYNLGIFYWKGRDDLRAAVAQFRKVAELTKVGDRTTLAINADVSAKLDEIASEAASKGVELR